MVQNSLGAQRAALAATREQLCQYPRAFAAKRFRKLSPGRELSGGNLTQGSCQPRAVRSGETKGKAGKLIELFYAKCKRLLLIAFPPTSLKTAKAHGLFLQVLLNVSEVRFKWRLIYYHAGT